MKSNLISWIRPLHYIWQAFGFAYFDDGLLRFFEALYFILVLTSSFSCLYMAETWLAQFHPDLFDVRLVVMSIATQWHELYPLVSLIRYRFSSARVRQLIEFTNYLCAQRLGLRSVDYAKMLFIGIAIFGQFGAVVYAAVTYFNSLTGFDSNPKMFFCTIKSSFSVAFPALQFVWWILLFRYLFVKSKDQLLQSVACTADIIGDGTSIRSISHSVQQSLNTVKDIVEMKRRVTRHYGSFVLLYPVGWLTALLHTCSLLSSDVGSVHVVILLVHAIASLFQFYLPFWSCQKAIISMKKSLYAIRKVMVIDQPSFANKQLTNFLLGLLHDDLNFKICDLVTLANKQFLSLVSS